MPSIAILGASADRSKFGNKAVRAFRQQGYAVLPINPHETEIEGLRAYPTLLEVPGPIDMVTFYVPWEIGLRVIDHVAAKRVVEVWFNPGAESPALLARARALGAALLVAVNSDASARRLGKGEERPINALEDRLAVIAGLSAVDAVTWFEEDTPESLIHACRPEVLVKGGDWPVDRIVGAPEVLARGGRVVSIPFEHERSTSRLISRIRGAGA